VVDMAADTLEVPAPAAARVVAVAVLKAEQVPEEQEVLDKAVTEEVLLHQETEQVIQPVLEVVVLERQVKIPIPLTQREATVVQD
jgi:CDP-diacylglycerol pyrophosphatase